jgi:hypothetical protein
MELAADTGLSIAIFSAEAGSRSAEALNLTRTGRGRWHPSSS